MRIIKLPCKTKSPEIVTVPDVSGADFLKLMQDTCNTSCIATVPALALGPSFHIVVDEEGLMKADPQLNIMATALFEAREPLFGDCMIAEIGIDPESGEPDLMPVHDIDKVHARIIDVLGGNDD